MLETPRGGLVTRCMAMTGGRSAPRWWALLSLGLLACVPVGDPALDGSFQDDFERAELGEMWRGTGGPYRLVRGQLRIKGARNRPLWFARRLPRDVRIEFDVRSESESGDVKVEVFGDGQSKADSVSYTATSYVLIFGGWNNTKNVLARLDEHGTDRVEGPRRKVEKGRTYRLRIERRGAVIAFWADEELIARMDDPEPLQGRGHDHFAFNNWQSELWFDNLKIEAL